MTRYNLPPGCNVSDLPGNSKADAEYEQLWNELHSCFSQEFHAAHGGRLIGEMENGLDKIADLILEKERVAFNEGFKTGVAEERGLRAMKGAVSQI